MKGFILIFARVPHESFRELDLNKKNIYFNKHKLSMITLIIPFSIIFYQIQGKKDGDHDGA
jgi:hypothetical protein